VIADFGISKHLDSPNQQLLSVAGSFGYVAPEVLKQKGHGKPVDIWSIGIITYVLLCGYLPFRSETAESMAEEMAKAKIEFHSRYWSNISNEAKEFIVSLLNIDPAKRPSAAEALEAAWLTSHDASTEHDIGAGLRENFSAKAKWRNAFNVLRASSQLGHLKKAEEKTHIATTSDEEEVDHKTDAPGRKSPLGPKQTEAQPADDDHKPHNDGGRPSHEMQMPGSFNPQGEPAEHEGGLLAMLGKLRFGRAAAKQDG